MARKAAAARRQAASTVKTRACTLVDLLRSQAHATISGAAMKHVMVSYKREDEPRVARLVRALMQHGLTLW